MTLLQFLIPICVSLAGEPTILEGDGRTALLSIDQSDGDVSVEVERGKEGHPRAVEITLYDKDRRPMTFELKALTFPEAGNVVYSGKVIPANQSYVGVELRIPLSKGRTEVFRTQK